MILCFQDMLRVATCQLAHLGTGLGWGRLRYLASLSLHFPTRKSEDSVDQPSVSAGCLEWLLCSCIIMA